MNVMETRKLPELSGLEWYDLQDPDGRQYWALGTLKPETERTGTGITPSDVVRRMCIARCTSRSVFNVSHAVPVFEPCEGDHVLAFETNWTTQNRHAKARRMAEAWFVFFQRFGYEVMDIGIRGDACPLTLGEIIDSEPWKAVFGPDHEIVKGQVRLIAGPLFDTIAAANGTPLVTIVRHSLSMFNPAGALTWCEIFDSSTGSRLAMIRGVTLGKIIPRAHAIGLAWLLYCNSPEVA